MPVAFIYKVVVDFIGEDYYIVAQTNFGKSCKLFPGPYPADRIVGAAEDEELYIVFNYLPFKILKVDEVFSIFFVK